RREHRPVRHRGQQLHLRSSRGRIMAANYLSGLDPTASSLTYQQVQASASITSTSGTFATMSSMSITVHETGRYTIDAGVDISMNASAVSTEAEVALFNNGSVIPNTTFKARVIAPGISLSSIGFSIPSVSHAPIDLTVGDTVTFRFRRSSGN